MVALSEVHLASSIHCYRCLVVVSEISYSFLFKASKRLTLEQSQSDELSTVRHMNIHQRLSPSLCCSKYYPVSTLFNLDLSKSLWMAISVRDCRKSELQLNNPVSHNEENTSKTLKLLVSTRYISKQSS